MATPSPTGILHDAVRLLSQAGGSDIVIVDGAIYEITTRQLDTDTVRQAVSHMIEERDKWKS